MALEPMGVSAPRGRRRNQFGSLWLNSDIKFPEAPDLEPHIERMQHYGANHSTPWEHFHLLHGSKSGFNLLTKDILDEVQSSLIARDIYYDSSRALQQAVDDADAGVAPQELQDLVRQMHKDCIKTCLQKDIDILNTISEGKKSVEDYLVQRGVPQDKAQRVAQGWYSRCVDWRIVLSAQKRIGNEIPTGIAGLGGSFMSWWSLSKCPCFIDDEKDSAKEKSVVKFLNDAAQWVDDGIVANRGMGIMPSLARRRWYHTGNTLIRPMTGAGINSRSLHGSGCRKPDCVLVETETGDRGSFEWTDVISAMEMKYRNTESLKNQAMRYMAEVARLVLTNQVGRRYFVGLVLLGPDLFICVHTRGGSAVTEPIDVYGEIDKYLKTIAWFKNADLEFLGYDKSIVKVPNGTLDMKWEDQLNGQSLTTQIISVIYSSNSGVGRSTRILGLSCKPPGSESFEYLICKDVWQNGLLYPDSKIHKLLEESGRVKKTCDLLGSKFPEAIKETSAELQLTNSLFKGWQKQPGWDDNNDGKYPAHLPIRDDRFPSECLRMTHPETGGSVLDLTSLIVRDMFEGIEVLGHFRTMFRTSAVKCTWFSCRREFLNCILGALLGHLEAYRRGLIHRDTSDGNTWMWIPQTDDWYAVPTWYINDDGQAVFDLAPVGDKWFPRRPGIVGDFGLALDMLKEDSAANGVHTTGTYPFSTTAPADAPPDITHDLESYIYLIWLIGVNFKGPYNDVQRWPPPQKQCPIVTNVKTAEEADAIISSRFGAHELDQYTTNAPRAAVLLAPKHTPTTPVDEEFETRNRRVPGWAKMGAFDLTTDAVQRDKKHLDYATFEASLQPYWKVGDLKDGWRKLYDLLWPTEEDPVGRTLDEKRSALTHAGLIAVIREMIKAIPAASDGAPSMDVVRNARDRYNNSIKRLLNANLPPPPPLAGPQVTPRSSSVCTFVNTTSADYEVNASSQKKRSSYKSSGRRPQEGRGAQRRSHSSRLTSRISNDASVGSNLAAGGSGSGWSGPTHVPSDIGEQNKRRKVSEAQLD